jgi:hypothetical protein
MGGRAPKNLFQEFYHTWKRVYSNSKWSRQAGRSSGCPPWPRAFAANAKLIESTLVMGVAVLRFVDEPGQFFDRINIIAARPRFHVRPRSAAVQPEETSNFVAPRHFLPRCDHNRPQNNQRGSVSMECQ